MWKNLLELDYGYMDVYNTVSYFHLKSIITKSFKRIIEPFKYYSM